MGAIMLQGTGSDVGKSVLVAGLCRLLANRGFAVRPFKPQNMSNNAAVTVDPGKYGQELYSRGTVNQGEIGRAQALQALACRVPPHVNMNPVLLKPQSDTGAQVILQGRMAGTFSAAAYQDRKPQLMDAVLSSYSELKAGVDIVVVEGAGSPAETNLRAGDIANMGFALAADVPVVLVGDIDRGGVIASIVGTHSVLDEIDRNMIKGFIINKFRGDVSLFDDGYADIEQRTGWRGLGILPWLPAVKRLPPEDAVVLDEDRKPSAGHIHVAVPLLSRIANFDDFDPLKLEPGVRLEMIAPGNPLPAGADIVILPGTKATIADLAFFRQQGWDIDLKAHHRRGGRILGICGGYQMLGKAVHDPDGVEGSAQHVQGLGYLDIETVMTTSKTLLDVTGTAHLSGVRFRGYEMHIGETTGEDTARPVLRLSDGRIDGAQSGDGRVSGCYIHGLFSHTDYRAFWLETLGCTSNRLDYTQDVDRALDEIAGAMENTLDIDSIIEISS